MSALPTPSRERLLEQEVRNLSLEVKRLRDELAKARGQPIPLASGKRAGPDPDEQFPLAGNRALTFLRNVITRPNIEIGEYTYYADNDGADRFEERNVLFQTEDPRDRLSIGRFCSIASGVRFLMNGSNHPDRGSTFPFWAFGRGWHERTEPTFRGPIVIGNDVWLALECCILPNVTIGDGAIVGARAVVTKDVPAYSVVVGNPARVIRMRYDEATIAKLEAVRWWDWPADRVTRNLPELVSGRWDDLT
jgi:virginiamycin A acetyltransferase